MSITVDIQYASNCNEMPSIKKLTSWAKICEESVLKNTELTIRIVDIEEISELNKTWRGIDKPTNVLSFPAGKNFVTPELIGDIVICAPVVMKEAKEQQKQIEALKRVSPIAWTNVNLYGKYELNDITSSTSINQIVDLVKNETLIDEFLNEQNFDEL